MKILISSIVLLGTLYSSLAYAANELNGSYSGTTFTISASNRHGQAHLINLNKPSGFNLRTISFDNGENIVTGDTLNFSDNATYLMDIVFSGKAIDNTLNLAVGTLIGNIHDRNNGNLLKISNQAVWKPVGLNIIGGLTFNSLANQGGVTMESYSGEYSTLTVNSSAGIDGAGVFRMHMRADFLDGNQIAKATSGDFADNHTVMITLDGSASSVAIRSEELILSDNILGSTGKDTFTLGNAMHDFGGTVGVAHSAQVGTQIIPIELKLDPTTGIYSIMALGLPGGDNTSKIFLADAVKYAIYSVPTPTFWTAEADTVFAHLRDRSIDRVGVIWIRAFQRSETITSELQDGYEIDPFKKDVFGFMAGYDINLPVIPIQGDITVGVTAGYGTSSHDLTGGTTGGMQSFTIGLYSSYLHKEGYFVDLIAKINRYDNSFDVLTPTFDVLSLDFAQYAFGAGISTGKEIYIGTDLILIPKIKFTFMLNNGTNYDITDGSTYLGTMPVELGMTASAIPEIGAAAYYRFKATNGIVLEPFADIGFGYDAFSKTEILVNNTEEFLLNTGGFIFRTQVGVKIELSNSVAFSVDYEFKIGQRIVQPYAIGGSFIFRF